MTLVDRSLRRQFTAAMALAMALALLLSGTALAQTTADEVAAVPIDDSCNDVPEDGFTDVPETNTFDDEIECLKAYGFTEGSGDGTTYEPAKATPRWQMVQFVARVAAEADEQLDAFELPEASDQGFEDISNLEQRFQDNINIMAEIGVVEGLNATTFDPYSKVKRDQMASFINRLQGAIQDALGEDPDGFTTGEDFFPDVSDDNVHKDNINGLASVGIVQGKVDGDYDPRENVTRGQMSAFIMRHYEVNVDNGVLTSKFPGTDPGVGGLVTAVDEPNDEYSYLPDGETEEVDVEYDADDNFTIDGAEATMAAFEAQINVGDRVGFADDESDDDVDTHNLVNAEDATDGVVGNVDTDGDESYDIIEPNTGAILTTYDYNTAVGAVTDNVYSTDGTNVGIAAFEADLNEGDLVEVTTSDEGVRTHSLTNQTVSGMVEDVVPDADGVEAGAQLGFMIGILGDDPADDDNDDYFEVAGAASYTVDGEAAVEQDFADDVSVGDTASYSRDNGVVTLTLVNETPASQSGEVVQPGQDPDGGGPLAATALGGAADGGTLLIVRDDGPTNVGYPAVAGADLPDPVFLVDGVVSTEAELEADLTAGDLVSVIEEDSASDTGARVALSNTSLAGTPENFVLANDTIDVVGQDGETPLYVTLDYTAVGAVYADSDSIVYVVDGTETDEAGFEAGLATIDEDSILEVAPITSDGGTVVATEFRLTTE